MKLLFSYIKKYWKLIALALLLAAINQSFSFMDPLIFRQIIDRYVTRYQDYTAQEFFQGVGLLLAAAVGVAFVSRTAKNFQDYVVNVVTQRLGAQMYADGLRHSLELPFQVFEDQSSGETLGRLQKVRTDVERVISIFINVLFTTVVGLVFVIIYGFRVHWAVVPVFLLTIPLLGGLSSALGKRLKAIQQVILGETTALAGATTESLRNIELVKSLGLAQQEIARLNSTTDKILGLELKKVRYLRSLSFIQGTSVNFVRTCILGLLMYLIFSQQITFGEFFSLWFYSFFIFGSLQQLGTVLNTYREAEASLESFQEILDTPIEPVPVSPVPVEHIDRVTFDCAAFQYHSAAKPSLRDVSFEVQRGETVAFVGPSGSGKTTLVKLLVGLYPPHRGRVLYNEHLGSEIDLNQLREHIGLVTQDTQLFAGTIRENLLFVRPGATDEECLDVLHKAAAQGLLARAENGLDTVIGEGGVKVSGGERQRLSIARALLRHPDLLVFDEATSSLDSLTEDRVSETIREISRREDMIVILIAHRLSTVMHADRIYVLERGYVVESGTHADLVEAKGLYYAMWRQQTGERQEGEVEILDPDKGEQLDVPAERASTPMTVG